MNNQTVKTSNDEVGLVEYSLILVLVAVVAIVIVNLIGGSSEIQAHVREVLKQRFENQSV